MANVIIIIKIMKNEFNLFTTRKLIFTFIFPTTILLLYMSTISSNSIVVSATNLISEKNSTNINSSSAGGENEVGMTYIISEPNMKENGNTFDKMNESGPSLENQSDVIRNNGVNNTNIKELTQSPPSYLQNQSTASKNSSFDNELQRGEYKVDSNGIHFYNIDNCSKVKGSSGIGNLSECEDAEKEMKDE